MNEETYTYTYGGKSLTNSLETIINEKTFRDCGYVFLINM